MSIWNKCWMLIALLMLTGCSASGNQGEELAVTARGGYLASQTISMRCTVTADYGERVYHFSFDSVTEGETTELTLTAPDTLAGLVVTVEEGASALAYEGVLVDTGALSEDGLTPITAIPALVEGLRSGYIQSSLLEEGVLTLTIGDPDSLVGVGQELVLTLDGESGDLVRGEIFWDGFRVIDCEVTEIVWDGLQGE